MKLKLVSKSSTSSSYSTHQLQFNRNSPAGLRATGNLSASKDTYWVSDSNNGAESDLWILQSYLPMTRVTSSTGHKGDTGPKGDKGDRGEKGEKGDRGEKGEKGDPAPPAPKRKLQAGKYRIRSLDGQTLLTTSREDRDSGNSPSVYAWAQSPIEGFQVFQTWSVESLPNGNYAIQSENLYMGAGSGQHSAGTKVLGVGNRFEWDIQDVGGFAWSLRVPNSELSLGVGNRVVRNGDEITLATSDSTPSQIWFIEKYVDLGPENLVHSRAYQEGKYLFQSFRDEKILITLESDSVVSGSYRIAPGRARDTKFELKYVGGAKSTKFTLSVQEKSGKRSYVGSAYGSLGLVNRPQEFYLAESTHKGGYFLCLVDSDPGRPQVISNEILRDNADRDYFDIQQMADTPGPGFISQMWRILPPE